MLNGRIGVGDSSGPPPAGNDLMGFPKFHPRHSLVRFVRGKWQYPPIHSAMPAHVNPNLFVYPR